MLFTPSQCTVRITRLPSLRRSLEGIGGAGVLTVATRATSFRSQAPRQSTLDSLFRTGFRSAELDELHSPTASASGAARVQPRGIRIGWPLLALTGLTRYQMTS
jgi:hypothetical protein